MVRNLTESHMENGIAFFGLFRAILGVLVAEWINTHS